MIGCVVHPHVRIQSMVEIVAEEALVAVGVPPHPVGLHDLVEGPFDARVIRICEGRVKITRDPLGLVEVDLCLRVGVVHHRWFLLRIVLFLFRIITAAAGIIVISASASTSAVVTISTRRLLTG